ncbi:helix-turn-helix domain-containing protein [Promicromonospora sp. NPDC090134]|uniref:helix-turn-helix domain-containing protein n=1 Tax=Promicromonospora sp. NPDC090134 TaxID=3364408 RepID=UPI0038119DCF
MDSGDELKEFLRASRARLRPSEVGLPRAGTHGPGLARRVPGLRREEVAQLAGVSVDYYARLEQGRTRQVSDAVLSSVADALRLNPTEREYLFTLVSLQTQPESRRSTAASAAQRVRPSVRRTLAAFTTSPSLVMGLGMQVLAMNSLARAVFSDLSTLPQRERNMARWTFLSAEARALYDDWEVIAAEAAAVLRADAGAHPDNPTLNELVGELTVKSADFRRLWADHGIFRCGFGTIRMTHPVAGPLSVDYEALDVPAATDQKIVVYMAPEGSRSEDALRMLASWTATAPATGLPRTQRAG